ncbi:hypothetical protein [Streptomyces sp. Da 82-17]|uniref:hypothetical protein n=1 Tax=Streptomyces sp. Da 82-17 TaxID=3377116 RepID=UPI0038D3E231
MGWFKNKEEAMRAADDLIEATRPEKERLIKEGRKRLADAAKSDTESNSGITFNFRRR